MQFSWSVQELTVTDKNIKNQKCHRLWAQESEFSALSFNQWHTWCPPLRKTTFTKANQNASAHSPKWNCHFCTTIQQAQPKTHNHCQHGCTGVNALTSSTLQTSSNFINQMHTSDTAKEMFCHHNGVARMSTNQVCCQQSGKEITHTIWCASPALCKHSLTKPKKSNQQRSAS